MKRENGITLISLVITAMVMAILAGITISATIGDDGLLTTAQNQKEKIKNMQKWKLQRMRFKFYKRSCHEKTVHYSYFCSTFGMPK